VIELGTRRTAARALLAAFCSALALALAACDRDPNGFKSTDITGADFGRSLSLTGDDGRPRTLADFRGKVVVVFFGYTQCPDVCPTTLAELAQVIHRLGDAAARVQVLVVTVDPERDTPEILKRYVAAFDPRFLGLYGDLDATRRTAKEFRVYFQKRPGTTPGSYSMDHSSQCYVFDPKGRLRLLVSSARVLTDLPHDIRALLAGR